MALFCGIDWATDHHDVAVVDDDGRVVARGRVGNDAAGFAQLLMLLAEAGDTATQPMPVGIETDRGLWVAALRETGRVLYPINPLAASRYRARYGVSGAKSDGACHSICVSPGWSIIGPPSGRTEGVFCDEGHGVGW
ncbi:putative transposase [Mycobacterium xenopi RIVM700367]|uniref:IS110 family transposase n=1 Tax=Mycobacterium xenopi TaxID=1789 RepID=UPI00025AD680|nr:transposase [Mycobacterium xenopi]EID14373.1 putative transposase [Mycobacterium xenopi RIVM700367]